LLSPQPATTSSAITSQSSNITTSIADRSHHIWPYLPPTNF
jgi:hypothetical protein